MFCRNLFITVLLIGIVAVSAATGNHGKNKASSDAASGRAFNVFDMMMDMVHPTTKPSSPEMLAITKAASAAVTTVDSVAGTIRGLIDKAKSVQSMTKSVMQDVIDGVVNKSQSIARKQGGQPGCVTEMLGRVGALGMQLALDEVECPGNKIASLENMVETVVEAGQTLMTIAPKAALSLDLCERKGGPLEIICRAKIVADMTGRAADVGIKATKVATDAVTMAGTIAPSLSMCAGLKVGSVAGRAADLVGKFGACSGKALMDLFG